MGRVRAWKAFFTSSARLTRLVSSQRYGSYAHRTGPPCMHERHERSAEQLSDREVESVGSEIRIRLRVQWKMGTSKRQTRRRVLSKARFAVLLVLASLSTVQGSANPSQASGAGHWHGRPRFYWTPSPPPTWKRCFPLNRHGYRRNRRQIQHPVVAAICSY